MSQSECTYNTCNIFYYIQGRLCRITIIKRRDKYLRLTEVNFKRWHYNMEGRKVSWGFTVATTFYMLPKALLQQQKHTHTHNTHAHIHLHTVKWSSVFLTILHSLYEYICFMLFLVIHMMDVTFMLRCVAPLRVHYAETMTICIAATYFLEAKCDLQLNTIKVQCGGKLAFLVARLHIYHRYLFVCIISSRNSDF